MSIKTIHSFKAAAADFARTNRYEVEMFVPKAVDSFMKLNDKETIKDMRKILLNCSEAVLPGKSLATFESRLAGPIRSIPYDRIYNPTTFTFYADSELREWHFFQEWMKYISESSSDNYMSYYDQYISNVTIGQLDMLSRQTRYSSLEEAYPISISDINYSYKDDDTIIEFQVEFKYRKYTEQVRHFSISSLIEGVSSGPLDFILNAASTPQKLLGGFALSAAKSLASNTKGTNVDVIKEKTNNIANRNASKNSNIVDNKNNVNLYDKKQAFNIGRKERIIKSNNPSELLAGPSSANKTFSQKRSKVYNIK